MNQLCAKTVITVLLIGSLLWAAGCRRSATKPPTPSQNAMGEVVGEETAKLAGPGAKVLLLAPAKGDPAGLWIEPVLQAFTAALKQHGNGTVAATERVKARTDDPSPTREELTAAQLEGLLDKAGGATALVSFVGFPVLDEAQIASLKKRQIKVVALYTAGPQAGPHYKKLLEARALDLAILPRMEPPAGTQSATAPREVFSRQFQMATPQTATQLTF